MPDTDIDDTSKGFLQKEIEGKEWSTIKKEIGMACSDIVAYQGKKHETRGRICIIEVPPKIWWPKVESRYRMPEYASDINHGAWGFSNYGKSVYRPKLDWQDKQGDDVIDFQESYQAKLDKDLRMGKGVDDVMKQEIMSLIKKYWDCFCKEDAERTIIGYEFGIDARNTKPVCCQNRLTALTKPK